MNNEDYNNLILRFYAEAYLKISTQISTQSGNMCTNDTHKTVDHERDRNNYNTNNDNIKNYNTKEHTAPLPALKDNGMEAHKIENKEKISTESIEIQSMALTNQFVESLHHGIGKSIIVQWEKKYPSLQDKMNHYPEQFWATAYGKDYFNQLLHAIATHVCSVISKAHDNSEKIDENLFTSTVKDLLTIYERDRKDGKIQLLKIKKAILGNKKLPPLEFMLLIKKNFEKYHKKHPLLQVILADFEHFR